MELFQQLQFSTRMIQNYVHTNKKLGEESNVKSKRKLLKAERFRLENKVSNYLFSICSEQVLFYAVNQRNENTIKWVLLFGA